MGDDKPVTQGDVRRWVVRSATIAAVIAVLGGLSLGLLYMLACANMPTGCH